MNGEVRYFLTYSGVQLPFNLVTPLEPEQIANRNTYFKGYFDERGRLIGFDKVVYGELELAHRYVYRADGSLESAEITDIDGDSETLRFEAGAGPA